MLALNLVKGRRGDGKTLLLQRVRAEVIEHLNIARDVGIFVVARAGRHERGTDDNGQGSLHRSHSRSFLA